MTFMNVLFIIAVSIPTAAVLALAFFSALSLFCDDGWDN